MQSHEPPSSPKIEVGHTLVDRLLDVIVRTVRERKEPDGILQRLLRAFRIFLTILSVGDLIFVSIVLALMEWHGEKNWILAFMLYLPPTGWLLPFVVLTPVCLLFHWRLIGLHFACAFVVMVLYMDPNWGGPVDAKGPTLKVLTNNRGEANYTSPTKFIGEQKPDIVALQEAGREQAYQDAFPELHVKAVGEFTLLSRFPILAVELLPLTLKNNPVGARFEVDCNGRKLAVYNIHIVSPRRDLDQMRGLGFPVLILAPAHSRYGPVRDEYKANWRERIEVHEKLAALIESEPLPCLAVGDFNFPDHGHSYHHFASKFEDAFAKRGRGYGYTMPGTTRNPLSLFGPWLRIDYIWAAKGLRPVSCLREPGRQSQHRAVVAELEWTDAKE